MILSSLEMKYPATRQNRSEILESLPFVVESKEKLSVIVEDFLKKISTENRIGIFGTNQSAEIIFMKLQSKNFENIFFINSDSNEEEKLHNKIILNTNNSKIHEADFIITSSLTRSHEQKEILLNRGYSGKIFCLPNLKHLSTSLIDDICSVQQIKELKDLHSGKPAFIIGNGPSLNVTDPRVIQRDFIRFAGNGILNLENFTPDYYFALDKNAVYSWAHAIRNLNIPLLFPSHLQKELSRSPAQEKASNAVYFPTCFEQENQLSIENWQQAGFETGQTVICPMIQFAVHMGCSPLFLVGVDLSYQADRSNYFQAGYHPPAIPGYQQVEIPTFHKRMSRSLRRSITACRNAGGEIFNCAPTRNIPDLEYRDFHQVVQSFAKDGS